MPSGKFTRGHAGEHVAFPADKPDDQIRWGLGFLSKTAPTLERPAHVVTIGRDDGSVRELRAGDFLAFREPLATTDEWQWGRIDGFVPQAKSFDLTPAAICTPVDGRSAGRTYVALTMLDEGKRWKIGLQPREAPRG